MASGHPESVEGAVSVDAQRPQHQDNYQEYDVVIVGAGMAGASLALDLARSSQSASLSIALVDAQADTQTYTGHQFDPRVIALTESSRRWLDGMGVWHRIQEARLCGYQRMSVWDAEGTGQVEFDASAAGSDVLGHIVENSLIQGVLAEALSEHPDQITRLQPCKVEDLWLDESQPCLQLDNRERLTAPLVVGADGAQSQIRRLAGLQTREWDYGHSAIVCTVRHQLSHQFTAWQRFLETGPLAFLPLFDPCLGDLEDRYCSIVWSLTPDEKDELMALDDQSFQTRLGAAFEHRLGAIEKVSKRFSFPLRQRHAVDYVSRGIALVGDAAHTIHPLAGQGANLGFADVEVLSSEVKRGLSRGLSVSEPSLLRRYQRSRKADNLTMMATMEGFKRLFEADNGLIRLARNSGLKQVQSLPALKNQIIRRAMGL